jgi:prepilin-type processing-associated H-X9-DG protein
MSTNPYESPEYQGNFPQQAVKWAGAAVRVILLVSLLGLLLLLFMPRWPIGGAREAARRAQCSNNLHNIALALHNYESAYGCLPPAYTVDAKGKRLHSWRTLLLPFLEQKALYDKIDLAKPWDDSANKSAYDTPIRLYECPSSSTGRGKTTYFAVVSSDGCFKGAESASLADVKRRGQTLMLIEVAEKHAVHWMSPSDATEEMVLDRERDLEFSHPSGGNAAFVDGSVRYLAENTHADVLRSMITTDGKDDDIAKDR